MKMSEFYKWNNKLTLRNPTNRAWDFHDTVKLWCMMVAYKKYGKDIKFITTEYCIDGIILPDVYIEFKDSNTMSIEVQKEFTKQYTDKIIQRDLSMNTNTICVNLNDVPKDFDEAFKFLETKI